MEAGELEKHVGGWWLARLRLLSSTVIAAIALMLAGLFAGCGGATRDPVAVRVGDVSISQATVAHWAHAIGLGGTVGTSLGKTSGTPREKALHFLITAQWLIAEAAERSLAVSDASVEHGLKERMESVPDGHREFQEELSSTGQTVDDVKLEIKAELAAAALRELVNLREPGVTSGKEVIDYYNRHLASFSIPEKRLVDLIENVPSRAAAIALGRRLGSGARFSQRALQESVARESPAKARREGNGELVRGIFAAIQGTVAPPARFGGGWVLIVARGRVPGRTRSLKEVEVEIERHLLAERLHTLFAEFIDGYTVKWTTRTDCRPGFVVQKCSQYHGRPTSEGNPLSSG